MKRLKKKTLAVLVGICIAVLGPAWFAYAATTSKTVQAYQGVTIFYNNQQLTGLSQPYIIDDTTYVPLRLIMENFGKVITWDANNYRVLISDNTDNAEAEIESLKSQISQLENNVNNLEDELRKAKENHETIDYIEDYLIDKFKNAGEKYFSDDRLGIKINFDGDEKALAYQVAMDFNNSRNNEDLSDLDKDDIEIFLNDVEEVIYREIEFTNLQDAKLTGMLTDEGDSFFYVESVLRDYEFSWK